jgi:hypothetical protein
MVSSVDGPNKSGPINPAPAHTDFSASLAKNFINSIISAAKNLTGGGGFKLQIAAPGRVNNKA